LGSDLRFSIQVFINAIGSTKGATALIALMTSIQSFGLVNWMASTARQVFAFGRDGGLPFGQWIAKVDAAGTYPINSLLFVSTFVVLITLIALGSTVAFNAITSLQILSLMATYLVSLSCVIWRRIWGAPLPRSSFRLGRAALPINIIGLAYCVYLIIFLPWPTFLPTTLEGFNWASVMFVGIMALSAVYYLVWGRKMYQGPVVHVKQGS
jgi:choline transport protein